MAALFHVKALRQGGKASSFSAELPTALQYDFRAVVVIFYLSADFDDLSSQLAHVPNVFHIVGKHYDRKGTEPVVLAKIKVVNAPASYLNADDFAGHTLCLAEMIASLI